MGVDMDKLLAVQRMVRELTDDTGVYAIYGDHILVTQRMFYILFPDGGNIFYESDGEDGHYTHRDGIYKGARFATVEKESAPASGN